MHVEQNPDLLSWLEQKKVDPERRGTLLPFLSLMNDSAQVMAFNQIVGLFFQFRPSLSEGLAILEISTELIAMGKSPQPVGSVSAAGDWLAQLKRLRYPTTTQRDQEREKRLLAQPWPHGSSAKFTRRGDRSGVELKVFITSESDITKIVSSLELIKNNLNAVNP